MDGMDIMDRVETAQTTPDSFFLPLRTSESGLFRPDPGELSGKPKNRRENAYPFLSFPVIPEFQIQSLPTGFQMAKWAGGP